MKQKIVCCGFLIFLFISFFVVPMKTRAKIDPMGMYLDNEGNAYLDRISRLDWTFLNIQMDIIMTYPNSFQKINIDYDQTGFYENFLMKDYAKVKTKGKIVISIHDEREYFSSIKTKSELLDYLYDYKNLLKTRLNVRITNNFDKDVVIYVIPKEGLEKDGLLGYFYNGEFIILKDLPK